MQKRCRGIRRQIMTIQQIRYAVAIADCNSINEAAKSLFISQPSLSNAVRELEEELEIEIFLRTSRGVTITGKGMEFLSYARQLLEQYEIMRERFIDKNAGKKKFSVSMQHYSFAVKAFVQIVKEFDTGEYEFAVYETKTYEVIENVKNYISELGILFINSFNERILKKYFQDNSLEFTELFCCKTYVYLWNHHPLADREIITMEELQEYPCLAFEQGKNNSLFLSEEMLSDYKYKKIIRANDRATMLNLMVGLNGYTLCSGIICDELNGNNYRAVPLDVKETMTIGYVKVKGMGLSKIGERYIEELSKYKELVLKD